MPRSRARLKRAIGEEGSGSVNCRADHCPTQQPESQRENIKMAAAKQSKSTTATVKRTVKRTKQQRSEEEVRLDAYIPHPDFASSYVGRKVWGVWDFELLSIARSEKENVLLMGETGSGKTMLGEAYAAKTRSLYYSLPCDVSIDPSALWGKIQPTDVPGKFIWQDGPVTQVVREGGVLNLSEINFMPPKISATLYPLLDHRRYIPLLGHKGEVVRAHENLLVIADMNPNYRGTLELNAAFKNRFRFKVPWGYDASVENSLVKFPTLRAVAGKLRDMVGIEIQTPVSTNMLMEFELNAMNGALGLDFAIGNFVAAFEGDEQKAVENIFNLNKKNLDRDLAFGLGQTAENDDDLEEAEFYFEEDV